MNEFPSYFIGLIAYALLAFGVMWASVRDIHLSLRALLARWACVGGGFSKPMRHD